MNETVLLYTILGATILATGGLLIAMPRLTRPDVFFSVTVPPGLRDAPVGRAITARFRLRMAAVTALSLAAVAVAVAADRPALAVAAPGVLLTGFLPVFLGARRAARPHALAPSPVREAALTPRASGAAWAWPLLAGPFGVIAAGALVLVTHWSSLPMRIPVHWGANGRADGWIARTPAAVAGLLAEVTLMCAVVTALAWGVSQARRVRAAGAGAVAEGWFRRVTVVVLVVAAYLIALPVALLGLLAFGVEPATPLLWAAPTLAVLALVAVATWMGQGGTRLEPAGGGGQPAAVGDRTADSSWKLGLFYVDRDDPAFLVEKRFGIGYTLNFGHPFSWLLLALLAGAPLILALVIGTSP